MTKHIKRVLIANRGEIARRIARTCHEMGIETVALYSDADAKAAHVRDCDVAYGIGPAPSSESYLRMDRILEVAKRAKVDAIHPGYGFLSENAAFAKACSDAGVIFIGPSADAISKMGSKREAKAIAEAANVPVVPGYAGEDQSDEALLAAANDVGFPLLLKASAGGGGKGMRVVREGESIEDALAAAKREAMSSFGDDVMLIERYVERPRHIEVQILGDTHGNVVHLFERECSVQRRHQKVIEEAPSPFVDEALRSELGAAAVRLAKAIGYNNAGTVEFIVGQDKQFYFLEVNTRLQVEHPVTEAITGLDLVREQIRVAEGRALAFSQSELAITGWAVEARLYAEDPANDFLPQSGPVTYFAGPSRPALRIDSAVESGDEVSIHYDPMIAKLIAHAPTRSEAVAKLRRGLRAMACDGLVTNQGFLVDVLAHEAFVSGEMSTHFIADHFAEYGAEPLLHGFAPMVAALSEWSGHQERALLPNVRLGFTNNPGAVERFAFASRDGAIWDVELQASQRDSRVTLTSVLRVEDEDPNANATTKPEPSVAKVRYERSRCGALQELVVTCVSDVSETERYLIVSEGNQRFVHSHRGSDALTLLPRFPAPGGDADERGCTAPMPGKIIEVAVSEGDEVSEGQLLVIMEAMKMEHRVTASSAGTVTSVRVAAGDQVEAEVLLVEVEATET